MNHLVFFAAEAAEAEGIAALGIDPIAFLLQLTTFVILYFILKKYAFSTIVKLLEERRNTINDGIRLGREMEAKNQELDSEVQMMLKKARQEADGIIATSKEESSRVIAAAEATASKKADQMLTEARTKIDEDINKARRELKGEVLDLVATATEAILREKVTGQKDQELVKKAVAEAQR